MGAAAVVVAGVAGDVVAGIAGVAADVVADVAGVVTAGVAAVVVAGVAAVVTATSWARADVGTRASTRATESMPARTCLPRPTVVPSKVRRAPTRPDALDMGPPRL